MGKLKTLLSVIAKYRKFLFFICILFYVFSTHAQDSSQRLFTGNFDKTSISTVIDRLEDHFDVLIFFKIEDLPNQNGNWRFQDNNLEECLNIVLERTSLDFMKYDPSIIILADKQFVTQNLSSNYYQLYEQRLNDASSEENKENIVSIGTLENIQSKQSVTIAGKITDSGSNDDVIGATIFLTENKLGVSSDNQGRFSITVKPGIYTLEIKYIGYTTKFLKLEAFDNGNFDVVLEKEAITLDEVIVASKAADDNVNNVLIGVEQISAKAIKKLPTFLGQADVIKSLLYLPGVSTIGEGASGFNVRGGGVDQNLILQDETFVFNANHALGFFSTFNTDLIKGVTLYKGAIPAQYGGRLSSIVKVDMKDGDKQQIKLKGGIGLVSSRLSIEGPIKKEKTTFVAGGRFTYSNWLLGIVNVPDVQNSSIAFYDANARITHRFSDKASIVVSGYRSYDELQFSDEFGFEYQTDAVGLELRNVLSPQITSNFSATYSNYDSRLKNSESAESFDLDNGINYLKIKEHIKYAPKESLQLDIGGEFIKYELNPGKIIPVTANSTIEASELATAKANEYAAFLNGEWSGHSNITVSAGIRFTYFANVGAADVNNYENNDSPSNSNFINTIPFGNGEVIASYARLEPRISAKYLINQETSLKIAYNRTNQFVHQISNSDAATPVDIWQISNKFIEPQQADNFTLGLFKNFKNNGWETSIAGYYRAITNLVEYRDFADLIANDRLETSLLSAKGRAYGAELSLRKNQGSVTGWLSYTYSRTERLTDNPNPDLRISNGEWYRANFDKPHDLSLVTNIALNQRHGFSINFNYSTGRPTTAPIGNFDVGNVGNIPIYSERNALRIPDYYRLDIAYNLNPGFRKDKKLKTSWTFSVYNVLGRKNAYSVFYTQQPFGFLTANRFSVLGSAFPALTLNIELN